jgi:hypothetical protein
MPRSLLTGWDSPAVQSLINARGVELASFPRADAMVALYPFLTKLSLPRGIFDISADLSLPAAGGSAS